jgi:hypothetical protein
VLLRLGHAAYDGDRFELAAQWLRAAAKGFGEDLDAYSVLRLAQLDYLGRRFDVAAAGFQQVLDRPDLDPAHVPTIQLQLASALLQAGELEQARRVALRIGAVDPARVRTNEIATISAKGIVRYITGLQSEVPTADFIVRSLTGLETDSPTGALMQALARPFTDLESSLDYQDDAPFFEGELARYKGKVALAVQKYQMCVDLARDNWPSNWARYRLTELSDTTQ